ncbi:hypothetical protein NQ317_010377 [Molorchus minor]|uniref:Uncharacterized protein n=1 Tax=Molorchus minor TaxID=1323400 RepID=A0ABQ9IV99_9CUCU|nr:hypothetical protein NQ317_010377 [Molorchus minor]
MDSKQAPKHHWQHCHPEQCESKKITLCASHWVRVTQLAYLSHKEEIENYLSEKAKKERGAIAVKRSRLVGDMWILLAVRMSANFVKTALRKGGCPLEKGKTNFSCLASCTAEFTLQTLQYFNNLEHTQLTYSVANLHLKEQHTMLFLGFGQENRLSNSRMYFHQDVFQTNRRKLWRKLKLQALKNLKCVLSVILPPFLLKLTNFSLSQS